MQMGYIQMPMFPNQIQYQWVPMPIVGNPQFMPYMQYIPQPYPESMISVPLQEPKEVIAPPKLDEEEKYEEFEKEISDSNNILKPDQLKERWKRDNDKTMFQFIRDHCKDTGDTMQEILKRTKEVPNSQVNFWSEIANKLKWRGLVETLQQRFIKLHSMKGLSVREEQLLQKLYAKKKNNPNIKWDSILYHFPGRNLETILGFLKWKAIDSPIEIEWNGLPTLAYHRVFKITRWERKSSNFKFNNNKSQNYNSCDHKHTI